MNKRAPISNDFCRTCHGSGNVEDFHNTDKCLDCDGTGWLPGCGPVQAELVRTIPIKKMSDDDLVDLSRTKSKLKQAVALAKVFRAGMNMRIDTRGLTPEEFKALDEFSKIEGTV